MPPHTKYLLATTFLTMIMLTPWNEVVSLWPFIARDVRVQVLIWFQTFLLFTNPHFRFLCIEKVHLFRHFRLFQTFSHRRSHTPVLYRLPTGLACGHQVSGFLMVITNEMFVIYAFHAIYWIITNHSKPLWISNTNKTKSSMGLTGLSLAW